MIYPITILPLLALALTLCSRTTNAARRRPTRGPSGRPEDPSKYDRSITTFSPDGRLLQVEYGAVAASRGTTVACLDLDCISLAGDTARRRSGIVVAVVRPGQKGSASTGSSSPTHHVLSDKVHRIDDHAILITSGLSGDSRALAASARMGCQRLRLSYGEAPTLKEIANLVGSTQRELTRIGGARPYGVTAAVIGVDPIPDQDTMIGDDSGISNDDPLPGTPSLYRTEPGGTVDRCDYCASGKGAENALKALDSIMNYNCSGEDKGKQAQSLEAEHDEKQMLADIVRKVALAALDADGDPSFPKTQQDDRDQENEKNSVEEDESSVAKALVDLWLVEACPKRRGGARLIVARAVKRNDLDEASKLLIGPSGDRNERSL